MATSKSHTQEKSWLDSWHVNPSTNRDYDFIDGLRGVAMLMVLLGHVIYYNPHSRLLLRSIGAVVGEFGAGVMIFFALSGFLISWPFWKLKFKQSSQVVPSGYGWRRFWKIYPPLALCVLLYAPLYIFFSNDWSYVGIGLRWLVGLPFVLPEDGKFNAVVWTLVVEVQFYAFLPLLFYCLKKVAPKVSFWIVSLFFLAVPGLVRTFTGLAPTMFPTINPHFPTSLDFFALGVMIAGLENMGLLKKKWAWLAIPGLALWPLGLMGNAWFRSQPGGESGLEREFIYAIEKIASGCLLCLVANPQNLLGRWLSTSWLRWCGIISYEWYLFHQPLIGWARAVMGPAEGNLAMYLSLVVGSVLLSVTISAAIYRYFSLPILKFGRSRARPGAVVTANPGSTHSTRP